MASPYEDVLLVRVKQDGTPMWANRYDVQGSYDSGEAVAVGVTPSPGYNFYVSGFARSSMLGGGPLYSEDGLLLGARPANGAPVVSELFGGSGDERLHDVLENAPGNIVSMGASPSYGTGNTRAWLVERYDNILGYCKDTRFTPSWVKVPMPAMDPLVKHLPPDTLVQQPVTIDEKLVPDVICKKVAVTDDHVGPVPPPVARKLPDAPDEGNPPVCGK